MNEAPLGFALTILRQYPAVFFFICVICISVSDPWWFLSACGSFMSAVSKLCLPCGQLLVPYISRSGQSAVICFYFRESQ